jgi:large subunit ribosomal protein L24
MKIKKGDNVIIIAGGSKGKKGKVLKSIPREFMVVVEGVNMRKKSVRAKKSTEKGQIIERAMPIHVSNVKKTN